MASAVAYDARVKTQITGFTLKSFGTQVVTGEVPAVNGPGPGNQGTDGVWTSVVKTGSTGGLYAHYADLLALLTVTLPTV